ncbi:unnamed protein product [Cuscuta epithymum]|uniref:Uncharacterized protein n=1 Tax=Cuscuta epithymum TaxID=186058 RepID=A0AAV0CRN7_9ASTE|nr:unnamed protein product [Cuscuta epithymum]
MESPAAVSAASFADGSKAEKHPDPFFRRFEYPLLSKRLRKPDEAAGCRESKESAYFPSFTAKPPREFVWDTPESTIIHAGESEDESASGSTGLSIPSPPPYDDMEYYNPSGPSPPPPDSPRTIQKRMEERRKIAEEKLGACSMKEGRQFHEPTISPTKIMTESSPAAVSGASFSGGSKAERNPDPFLRRFEYPVLAKRLTKPDEAAGCREPKESAYFPSFTAKPPRESIWVTPESAAINAGESEDESESCGSSPGLSIPSPPPYDDMEYYNPSPSPPISPRTIQKQMKELRKTAEV